MQEGKNSKKTTPSFEVTLQSIHLMIKWLKKESIKLIMIGMALKKTIVVKAWLEDFEANRSIYSGNSGKMDD